MHLALSEGFYTGCHLIGSPSLLRGPSNRFRDEPFICIAGEGKRALTPEVEGEERERIKRRDIKIYPGWRAYERRASNRRIAILVLTPAVAQ